MARPAPDAFGTAAASGSNVLVNEAALIDALIPARTLAVMGDVFQRDAIMQINVHSNTDIVAMNGAIQSAMKDPGHDDTITNLAIVSHNSGDAAVPPPGSIRTGSPSMSISPIRTFSTSRRCSSKTSPMTATGYPGAAPMPGR